MTAPTKTINGIEAVGYMDANLCTLIRPNFELRCLGLDDLDCRCPGAPLNNSRGRGIWITKAQYLELRLMGEVK